MLVVETFYTENVFVGSFSTHHCGSTKDELQLSAGPKAVRVTLSTHSKSQHGSLEQQCGFLDLP